MPASPAAAKRSVLENVGPCLTKECDNALSTGRNRSLLLTIRQIFLTYCSAAPFIIDALVTLWSVGFIKAPGHGFRGSPKNAAYLVYVRLRKIVRRRR